MAMRFSTLGCVSETAGFRHGLCTFEVKRKYPGCGRRLPFALLVTAG